MALFSFAKSKAKAAWNYGKAFFAEAGPAYEKNLDNIQTTLDVAGMVPVIGEAADGMNGAISVARGDYVSGGLSFAAMVPLIGTGATGAKWAKKGEKAIEAADKLNDARKVKPNQMHHFGTIYGKNAKRMQDVIDKYGLKLDGAWNKEVLPHLGRHTQEYHDKVYRLTQKAAKEAGDDVNKFLKLYDEYVKKWVRENPDVMYKTPATIKPQK